MQIWEKFKKSCIIIQIAAHDQTLSNFGGFCLFVCLFCSWWCCHVKGPAEPQLVSHPLHLDRASIVISTDVPGYDAAVLAPSWCCAGGCPFIRVPPSSTSSSCFAAWNSPRLKSSIIQKNHKKQVNPCNWAEQQCYQRSHSCTSSLFFLSRNLMQGKKKGKIKFSLRWDDKPTAPV